MGPMGGSGVFTTARPLARCNDHASLGEVGRPGTMGPIGYMDSLNPASPCLGPASADFRPAAIALRAGTTFDPDVSSRAMRTVFTHVPVAPAGMSDQRFKTSPITAAEAFLL